MRAAFALIVKKGDRIMPPSEFSTRLALASKMYRVGMRRGTAKAGNLVKRSAKKNVTGGKGGGVLNVRTNLGRGSITSRVEPTPRGYRAVVGASTFYMLVHEKGMVIRARNAPFMLFKYKGKFMKVKKVTIPKREWLRPAFEENRRKIVNCFDDEVATAFIKAGLM